jgi:hypothetical protein
MLAKQGRRHRLLVPAAMVIGLGVVGWILLGKDLIRYIRISTM